MKPAAASPALTPKLRFSEFRKAPGWDACPLQEIAEFVGDRVSVAELNRADYVSTENLLPDFGGFSLPSSFPAGGSVVRYRANDILAANIRPYLKKIWLADRNGGASNDVLVIRAQTSINHQYLSYVLKNDRFVAYVMSGAKGLKMPRGDVSLIREYPVPTPSLLEQHRIAACLSSLDDLIAAESQKLDTLKTHKKGLMQQLFPREGETRPRLRFPEFRKAGEWQEKALVSVFPITSSKRVHESEWTPTGVPFYRAREIVSLSKQEGITPLHISEELYSANIKLSGEICAGHLLVTGVGSIGVPYLVRTGDRFYFKDGNIVWLKNDEAEVIAEFLLRLYETDFVQTQIREMSDVGTVATYTIKNAKRTRVIFPNTKAEQHRIASCLSSLDDLIAAQADKLEALKTHKKGLMQQLFPAPAEVAG